MNITYREVPVAPGQYGSDGYAFVLMKDGTFYYTTEGGNHYQLWPAIEDAIGASSIEEAWEQSQCFGRFFDGMNWMGEPRVDIYGGELPPEVTLPKTASYEVKPLEPDQHFRNWEGQKYRFEPFYDGTERQGLAVYDGADQIGSLTWSDEGDTVYLRSAYVEPGYRGEGIFKDLVHYLPEKPVHGDFWPDSPLNNFFDKWNQRFSVYYEDDEESPYEDEEWEDGEWLDDMPEASEPKFVAGDRVKYDNMYGTVMETPAMADFGEPYWYMVHLDDGSEYAIREEMLDWEAEFSFTDDAPSTGILDHEPTGDLWPDYLPWSDDEQNYYRQSSEWVADPFTKWKTIRNPAGGSSTYPNYNPKSLWKFQDYLLTMEDRVRTATFNGLVFKDTWEPPKLWMEGAEMDYIFKDKDTGEYLRFSSDEISEMQRNDWIHHIPAPNSFINEYSDIETREQKRDLVSPAWDWPVDEVPDTIPWGEAEQDFYRTSAEYYGWDIEEVDSPPISGQQPWGDRRRPLLYSRQHKKIFIGTPGTHHEDLAAALGFTGEDWYDNMGWDIVMDDHVFYENDPEVTDVVNAWNLDQMYGPLKSSGWQRTGVSGIPANYTEEDPLDLQGKAPYIEAMNTEWWKLSPEEQRQTIINAFRATMLSPRMNLKSNAILYQLIMDIPADESNPDVFESRVREIKQKWDAQGQMGLEQDPTDVYALDEILPGKFMPGFWGNLRRLANLGPYANEIWQAADEDMKNGGTGKLFRQRILELQLPGVGPKVASFAWLALAPMTSELATVDVHMMKHLDKDYDSPKSDNEYFELEQQLQQERDQMYGPETPLAWYQWGVWDKRRTPGFHQDHTPLRAYQPTDFRQVDWPTPARPPRPPKPQPTMFDQMTLAKTSSVTYMYGDWLVIYYPDLNNNFMDWRYPVLIDIDEKKIFVGINGSYHSELIEAMGAPDADHGSIWVNNRNVELGHNDWYAGYFNEDGTVKIWESSNDPKIAEAIQILQTWGQELLNHRKFVGKSSANAYDIMYIPTTEEDIRDNVRQHMVDSGVSPNYWKFFKTPNNEVYLWNIAPVKNTSYDYDGFPSHADMVEKVKGFNPYDNFDMVDEADGYDFGWFSPDYKESLAGDDELVEAVGNFISQNGGSVV